MGFVVGCDVGSQSVKAILLSESGEIVAQAGSDYPIEYPQPTWAQQDARHWEKATKEAIARVIAESGVSKDEVLAIGIDAQVDGYVAVDAQGRPLHPAIIWMDRRAVTQTEKVRQAYSEKEIFELSGLNLDPYHVAPKIRWLADEHPLAFEQTRYFLMPGSYIAYYLSGEVGVDYSNASSMLLMDIRQRVWSPRLCEIFGISPDRLPPIYPANQVIGSLRREVAEEVGLSPKTRVVLGCGDEHAACLGAGVIRPKMVCDITGTAEPVCAVAEAPLFDASGLVETHCHAHPDYWLLENPGFVSGGNYRWFRDHFGQAEIELARQQGSEAYALLDRLAEEVPPGSEGLILLPCLMGSVTPTWNAATRGVFLGFSLAHTRAHFARAVLEGSAYGLRDIVDRMKEIGLAVEEIRAVGGGARSPLWRQIKADVTGVPVSLPQTVETTALGAAILALHGAGLTGTIEEACDLCVKVVETRYPQAENATVYEQRYRTYRAAYFALLPVFEEAARNA
ncbi:MAG: xylulokinase [Anaerolineales bacterium]|nr:xylulokinase [Anaerolineales bacterium]MCS7248715.1 xylulokinase [Anaerolineales bacterium]MDW8162528.1 xylulokinase [Anaerolineales bacterium]MDW8446063.1 xylulokinase [Anaerolineales bacterium]